MTAWSRPQERVRSMEGLGVGYGVLKLVSGTYDNEPSLHISNFLTDAGKAVKVLLFK
jgi:hypothetical protein